MKLCGVDSETSNRRSGSICAVGAVLLKDGVMVERQEYLKKHKSLNWMSKF